MINRVHHEGYLLQKMIAWVLKNTAERKLFSESVLLQIALIVQGEKWQNAIRELFIQILEKQTKNPFFNIHLFEQLILNTRESWVLKTESLYVVQKWLQHQHLDEVHRNLGFFILEKVIYNDKEDSRLRKQAGSIYLQRELVS